MSSEPFLPLSVVKSAKSGDARPETPKGIRRSWRGTFDPAPVLRAFLGTTSLLILLASRALLAYEGYVEPLEISDTEARQHAISSPAPAFPEFAKKMKKHGRVDITAFINEMGVVADVIIVGGDPILVAASEAALRTWKFKPFTDEKGKLRKAQARMVFNYSATGVITGEQ